MQYIALNDDLISSFHSIFLDSTNHRCLWKGSRVVLTRKDTRNANRTMKQLEKFRLSQRLQTCFVETLKPYDVRNPLPLFVPVKNVHWTCNENSGLIYRWTNLHVIRTSPLMYSPWLLSFSFESSKIPTL